MGCDIHLRLERRLKKDLDCADADKWQNCSIFAFGTTWGDRIYGMFAMLANVRNYTNLEHIPIRGLPEDCCNHTLQIYGYKVSDKDDEALSDWEVSRNKAQRWVATGHSFFYKLCGHDYVSKPDFHSPNWCTTQEMEDCINRLFKQEAGFYRGDYIEWFALLGAMKGYEESGEYECRAVFWFDN